MNDVSVSVKKIQTFIQNAVFFIDRHIYKHSSVVWKRSFPLSRKIAQSYVSKREVWCEIIDAKDYHDIACQKLWILVKISLSFRGVNRRHFWDTVYIAEMRGYRFLISASYSYPLKTIRIRILSVQTLLTAIRILSVSMVLLWYNIHRESKKFPPTFSTVASTLVVRF